MAMDVYLLNGSLGSSCWVIACDSICTVHMESNLQGPRMEESSLVSRKSIEKPLFEYSEQLEKKNKRGLLCCKCHIRVSLDVTYSSLLPMSLSLAVDKTEQGFLLDH